MPRQRRASPEETSDIEQREGAVETDNLLTVREVAKRLRVDTTTVRRWIAQGLLDAIPLPHQGKRQGYRIRKQTLDRLLLSNA